LKSRTERGDVWSRQKKNLAQKPKRRKERGFFATDNMDKKEAREKKTDEKRRG